MTVLTVLDCGLGITVQDGGWPGSIALGLSTGGVADTRAYANGLALLGEREGAVLEMAGQGGRFTVSETVRIALTGADMGAHLDGAALAWHAVHQVHAGQILAIGAPRAGVYGYLAVGGGVMTVSSLGRRSTHRAAGLGHVVQTGDQLPLGPDRAADRHGLILQERARGGGEAGARALRIVPSAQTEMFDAADLARLEATVFTRGARGNRQGVVLETPQSFALEGGQSIVSETVVPGDIQIPGDGVPVVLLADCQTTGGYPRIASVLPCDLPRLVQAGPGAQLRFEFVTYEEGIEAQRAEAKAWAGLGKMCVPLVRDPADIGDLLSYQLISGMIAGIEEEV
jgi:biotin-dependent carboxylase-like uncharacterized protein